jgi:hypothetical protein
VNRHSAQKTIGKTAPQIAWPELPESTEWTNENIGFKKTCLTTSRLILVIEEVVDQADRFVFLGAPMGVLCIARTDQRARVRGKHQIHQLDLS